MPEVIRINATDTTPLFEFNFSTGIMTLEGRSISSYPTQFYKPIYDLLDDYLKHPAPATTLNFKFDFFTTSAGKCLMDLFRKAESIGDSATIIWHYEKGDEDIKEAGIEFSEMVKVRFELREE